jgi:small subunit ribosomal protein S13
MVVLWLFALQIQSTSNVKVNFRK